VLQKKTIQLQVSLKAPLITVPQDPFAAELAATPKLVIDLGTIGVESNPQRPPPGMELDARNPDLRKYFFDRYSISVNDIAGLCIPVNRTYEDSKSNPNIYVLHKFTITTEIDVCTMPSLDIPKVKYALLLLLLLLLLLPPLLLHPLTVSVVLFIWFHLLCNNTWILGLVEV